MENEAVPKLPSNTLRVYEYMIDNSLFMDNTLFYFTEDTAKIKVWVGYGKTIATHIERSIDTVYQAFGLLQVRGFLKKLRHGGSSHPSAFQILPLPDDYAVDLQLVRQSVILGAQSSSKYDKIQDSITRLTNRVSELEAQVEELLNGKHLR
jgi:hypothetical protein